MATPPLYLSKPAASPCSLKLMRPKSSVAPRGERARGKPNPSFLVPAYMRKPRNGTASCAHQRPTLMPATEADLRLMGTLA
ncbi:hypothetical protein J1614_002973 [Plenodomus biglobosus]|nr:hypothetical protein J1614_002973 [Plenodomus biglobosus]